MNNGYRLAYIISKRLIDLMAATVLSAFLTPLMLVLAALTLWEDGWPVLFRQRRIGRHGRQFTMLKFRTMRVDTPNVSTEIMKAMGKSYVTRIGSLLRKTSLDELPQLWNILRGDMSFVGPRPALYNQDDLIALREAAGVHAVRPGITGLAQIRGRDDLDIPTKVAYDSEYVATRSLWLDLWILWRTVAAVLSARGNY